MNIRETHITRALLLLGCPEIAVQTSLALYTTYLLSQCGVSVVIAGNNAALEHITTADPAGHYTDKLVDLDTTIGNLAQKTEDFDICYVFVHNDAGVSYLATAGSLISGEAVGIIFGPKAQLVAHQCEEEGLKNIWARVVHNPRPLKSKITKEVKRWDASTK